MPEIKQRFIQHIDLGSFWKLHKECAIVKQSMAYNKKIYIEYQWSAYTWKTNWLVNG